MATDDKRDQLAAAVHAFVTDSFSPRFGELAETFESHPTWARLRELGTELWLDTGSLEDASRLWTREMSALTTNNALLNQEVQKGLYDDLIAQAATVLEPFGLSPRERVLEIAFILNARHGLRLVETFDACVSVEEHTDLANDVAAIVATARRYHAICPERFIIKIPLTPAGVLGTRLAAAEGIRINHTLGFSARQNYVVAHLARPAYVNVFLGRDGAFAADNGLGDGAGVGEMATLASQAMLAQLRKSHGIPTRQIGASIRSGEQVRDLAGLDVLTVPPKAAQGLLDLEVPPDQLGDRTRDFPELSLGPDAEAAGLPSLWNIDSALITCVDALAEEDLDRFTPDDVVSYFADRGCGDVFPRWTDEQRATSAAEGKIPSLDNWRASLATGAVGLDALLNLAGLHAFAAAQQDMDNRVASVLAKA